MPLTQIATAVAVLLAPLGAYLVAARQFSGKVRTSDASQLWEESRRIREWSVKRMQQLQEIVEHLEERVRELESHNGTLEIANRRLTKELEECQKTARP